MMGYGFSVRLQPPVEIVMASSDTFFSLVDHGLVEAGATDVTSVVILGSTGSIGRSALEVIAASGGRLRVYALVAHRNIERLVQQVVAFRPAHVVITSNDAYREFCEKYGKSCPAGVKIHGGTASVAEVVRDPQAEMVLSAVVGRAGLEGTWAAVDAGKCVALANKESLVIAGELIMRRARETGAEIFPVDSEHSAIFQTLRCGRREELRRILLTASGGPFREMPLEAFSAITPEAALAHPTWNMGPRVTVDSGTLINKALEIIEARWLFDLTAEQIGVVIHPQSIVHSMVEFHDGSVIAQLGVPDMRLPIHHALYRTRRPESVAPRLDWTRAMQLEFLPPDPRQFPVIGLGLLVAREGGVLGAVFNAAAEVATAAFLERKLTFDKMIPLVERAISEYTNRPAESLAQLAQVDAGVREEVRKWI